MDYLLIILPKLMDFLLLMALGFVIGKTGVIEKDGLPVLSALLLKVVLPCLTISILAQQGTGLADLWGFHRIVLWQAGGYLLLGAAGLLTARLMGLQYPASNVHSGCTVGGNYAYVVIPVVMALFSTGGGQEYIPICSAIDTVSIWTLGLALFTRGVPATEGESALGALLRRLANPIMVSIVGMLLLNSLHIKLPAPVLNLCESVGNVSCLGFVYIGCSICHMKRASFPRLYHVGWVPLMKLLVVPLLVYVVSGPFLPMNERIILMVILGAPTMSTSCMIAAQYGLDENYAAAAVLLSTLGCMATIPLLLLLTCVL